MQVVFVMFRADGARRSFPLSRDVTVIGRREDCDLRIPLTEVSRKHCRIIKDGGGLRIEDLGSSNGTYHNGARVQESAVQAGDLLTVGPVTFTVQIDGFPADDMIQPPQIADAESSSAGAQLEDSAIPATASPAEPTRAAGILAGRPRAPQGEDFAIAADDEQENQDDDVLDMNTTAAPPDEDQPKR